MNQNFDRTNCSISQRYFFTLQKVIPCIRKLPFLQSLSWKIKKDEVWAITGRNGSGKTLLAEIIAGKYNLIDGEINYCFSEKPEKVIKIVGFQSIYSLVDFRKSYYQKRFNHTETEYLPLTSYLFCPEQKKKFNIEKLMSRKLIHLSSGELRKFLIARILLEHPRMIIFDNPFIGLDINGQQQLNEIFYILYKKGIQLMFLIPSFNEIPSLTSHILEIDKSSASIFKKTECPPQKITNKENLHVDWNLFPHSIFNNSKIVVKMKNIDVIYKNQTVLQSINWEIKRGEKWALLGANGSGKSTLISYIFADNPISYSKKLILFDRKRGTGESIWDIKQRIGFTSSEMHLYYRQNITCKQVVESGFFDSVGLWKKCTKQQIILTDYLFDLFHIDHLKNDFFLRTSSGEQRLILFVRSLVKNPELLILDEPFHGLDDKNKNRCLQIIEAYNKQPNKSLIFVTHQLEEIPSSINLFFRL